MFRAGFMLSTVPQRSGESPSPLKSQRALVANQEHREWAKGWMRTLTEVGVRAGHTGVNEAQHQHVAERLQRDGAFDSVRCAGAPAGKPPAAAVGGGNTAYPLEKSVTPDRTGLCVLSRSNGGARMKNALLVVGCEFCRCERSRLVRRNASGDRLNPFDQVPAPKVIQPVATSLTVSPSVLDANSQGRWVTAQIELPSPYTVDDIDIDSVALTMTSQIVVDGSPADGVAISRKVTAAAAHGRS
jgi:hypothetical protein